MKNIKLFEDFNENENENKLQKTAYHHYLYNRIYKASGNNMSALAEEILSNVLEQNPQAFELLAATGDESYDKNTIGKAAKILVGMFEETNEGQEVAVIDMREAADGFVNDIKDSLDFASAKLYELKKMADEIRLEYPDLSKDITETVEPMMIELENEYPKKLKELLKKFH